MLGGVPDAARVRLINSFATTGDGHRTPIAVAAGLLGISTRDPRTPKALILAGENDVDIRFERTEDAKEHPNTLELWLRRGTRTVLLKAISIGAGNYEILNRHELTVAA